MNFSSCSMRKPLLHTLTIIQYLHTLVPSPHDQQSPIFPNSHPIQHPTLNPYHNSACPPPYGTQTATYIPQTKSLSFQQQLPSTLNPNMWPIPHTSISNQTIPHNPYQAHTTCTQSNPYIPTTYPYYQNTSATNQPQWPRQTNPWPDLSYPNHYILNPQQNPYNQTNTSHDNHFAQSFSKGLKLEFPKFDGENPRGWIRQAEK
jgi:hypothetical protein